MGYSGDEPQKVIIFDWDDTICPSSFFDRQQLEKMDELPESVCQIMFDISTSPFKSYSFTYYKSHHCIYCLFKSSLLHYELLGSQTAS